MEEWPSFCVGLGTKPLQECGLGALAKICLTLDLEDDDFQNGTAGSSGGP